MGAGASTARASLSEPFPVSPGLARDLDKLSMVAARILSTPDIYEVENLQKSGTCGEYMVLLKKGLEKKLLPFVAKTRAGTQEIVYQNPRRTIDSLEDRKAICSSLVNTMLRTITTVVACLASIQVASTTRESIVSTQRGGGVTEDVRSWLHLSGYIPASATTAAVNTPVEFTVDPTVRSKGISMQLMFTGTLGNAAEGIFISRGGTPEMPTGKGLKVQFLNPIPIPGPVGKSMLPLRIVDDAGQPWLAGIMYENIFKSLNADTPHASISQILEALFRRTQGWKFTYERRQDVQHANDIFQSYRRTGSNTLVFSTLNSWLQASVQGYSAAAAAATGAGAGAGAPPPPGYPTGFYPYPPPVAPAAVQFPPVRPLLPAGPLVVPPTGQVVSSTVAYDVPPASGKAIVDTFKMFRDLMPRQSCPAHVRAYTLAGRLNDDRTVDTAVCQDPYWREPTLSKVYPWTTFQYMCVKDWSKLGTGEPVPFESEWATFLDEIEKKYKEVGVTLTRDPRNLLDKMSVKDYDKLPICNRRALKFGEIQEGINKIQSLYAAHVPVIWGILNELIVVIQVEDERGGKRDVVRLHPKIVTGTTKTTEEYVNERAAAARNAIGKFYENIEKLYIETIVAMKNSM
jgi:hypothetical protein